MLELAISEHAPPQSYIKGFPSWYVRESPDKNELSAFRKKLNESTATEIFSDD